MPYATNYLEFRNLQHKNPQGIPILTEGDSWLAYPNLRLFSDADTNLVHHLGNRPDLNLLTLAKGGDELVAMLSGESKEGLIRYMQSGEFRCLLFSGGGNDIVGKWDLDFLLSPNPATHHLHPERWEIRLIQMEACYRYLCELAREYGRSKDRDCFKVITHQYDLAIPNGVGAQMYGQRVAGPWLQPFLNDVGLTTFEDQQAVVHHMLKAFASMLDKVAVDYPDTLVVVRTQGTLQANEWANEIHPTPAAFGKIADLIDPALRY